MTCADTREQLSALLDDALSPPERAAVEAHLALCAECGQALAELRGTVALLGRLGPVHAPAGFVDRVLAEAHRPSRPRRLLDTLFRPLRVKLPLEAAAVLLVAVSALYVYERTPELRQVAPPPTSEPASGPVSAAPAVKGLAEEAPSAGAPAVPGARVDKDVAREQATPARPPASGEGDRPPETGNAVESPAPRTESMPAPMIDRRAKTKPDALPEAKKEAPAAARPDAAGPTSSLAKVPKQSADPAPARDAAPEAAARSSSGASPPAIAAAPPAEAPHRAGGIGAVGPPPAASESSGSEPAAAAKSRGAAARLMRAADASGRLVVRDAEPAEIALDALLSRVGATRVARRVEHSPGPILVDVNVPAARYPELLDGLGRIGRWTTEYEAKAFPLEIRLEVAISVEP